MTRKPPPPHRTISKPTPRWQIVENVVATWEKIQERVPGVTVTQRAQVSSWWDPTVPRDVDVLVEATVGDRKIRIGIEVKDHGVPLDVGDVGQIVDLAKDVQLDHYVIVSASGYSKDAEKKAKHANIELVTIEEFETSDLWTSPSGSMVFQRSPEPVSTRFIYSREDFVALGDRTQLTGKSEEAILEEHSGKLVPLPALLLQYGYQAIEQLVDLLDQEMFEVQIVLPLEQWLKVHVNGIDVPPPDHLDVVYRYHNRPVPEYRFRVKGIEMTTVEMKLFGEERQVTMAAIPQPEGGSRIVIAHVRSKPKKTKVDVAR